MKQQKKTKYFLLLSSIFFAAASNATPETKPNKQTEQGVINFIGQIVEPHCNIQKLKYEQSYSLKEVNLKCYKTNISLDNKNNFQYKNIQTISAPVIKNNIHVGNLLTVIYH